MSLKDNKLEIAILAVAVVLIGGLGNLFNTPVVQKAVNAVEFNFEMVRAKSSALASLFDLNGREISRSYVNPFGNKKEDKPAEVKDTKAQPAAATKTAAKKADDKKTDDKKPKVETTVVGADPTHKAGGGDIAPSGSGGGNAVAGAGTNTKDGTTADNDKKGLTAEQWRSLVLSQPTKDNVNKMVLAYMDKELTDGEFFGIVKELLQSNNSDTQALGLSAASSFYSSTAFNTVASSYKGFNSDMQTKAMAYLLGFANAGRLGALASSLKSDNTEVVTLAAQVVIKGYSSAKNGTVSSQGNRTRGDAFENSLKSYTQFVTIFKDLAQSSQNSDIVSIANSALSQIQSGVATL